MRARQDGDLPVWAKIFIGLLVLLMLTVALLQVNNYRRLSTYKRWISQEVDKIPGSNDYSLSDQVSFYNIGRIKCGNYFKGTFKTSLSENDLLEFFESHGYRKIDLNDKISYSSDYKENNYILALVFEPVKSDGLNHFRFVTC